MRVLRERNADFNTGHVNLRLEREPLADTCSEACYCNFGREERDCEGLLSLCGNFHSFSPAAEEFAEKRLNLSFRSRRDDRGFSLWFRSRKREIPRHAACLGMTDYLI